jgi:hypothetical protein
MSKERLAFHEAAHAVMGLCHGKNLQFVSIYRGKRTLGRAVFRPGYRAWLKTDAIAAVELLLAGPVAEALKADPDTPNDANSFERLSMMTIKPEAMPECDESTIHWILDALWRARCGDRPPTDDEWSTVVVTCIHDVEDSVRELWVPISRVAQELLVRKKLSGDEVRQILGTD